MNKYLLRRIGVASHAAAARPTLSECIELVLEQSDALVSDVLDALKAPVLRPIKAGEADPVDPGVRHAVGELLDEVMLVRATFGDALRRLVYHSGSQDFGEAPMARLEDIQVFDIHALEAHIEQALARREVSRAVDDVLPLFNAQISALLGWTSVQPGLNPLKPEAFVRALQEMLATCVEDESVRAVLLRPSAIALGIGMAQLYRETCEWLRSQGVSPVTPVDSRAGRAASRGKPPETELERTLAILDKLRGLLGLGAQGGASGGGPQDFIHTVPAALVAIQDLKLEESMFQRLKRQALPVLTAPAGGAGTATLADDEPVLARARSRQIGRQLGEEVVRLMVDQMGHDERVPGPVRLQLRPLEPVLVRLAHADPRFFLDRGHPARSFMDRVVQASVVLHRDDQEAIQGFGDCIGQAVGSIMRQPAEGASFTAAWGQFERSWGDFEAARQRQRDEVRRQEREARRQREHEEERMALAQRFSDALMERLRNVGLPAEVAGFLRGPWAQVLAESSLRGSGDDPDPRGYLALVDELVWSVQRPVDGHDYARLVRLIPRLLARISEGLLLIRYPQEPVTIFLDELSALHDKVLDDHRSAIAAGRAALAARQARETPEAAAPQASAPAPLNEPDQGPESGLDSISPGPAGDLETGQWADLLLGGVWVRARLTWISRNHSLYMFVSGAGLAHAMTRRTMDRLQAQGRLRLGFAPPQFDLQIDTVHGLLTPTLDDPADPG